MKIAFYAGSCLPIHSKTLDERPLGGTETALIRLVEVLHARGHDVTVFTSHKSPPQPSPPQSAARYLPADYVFRAGMFDLFVCVKDWRPAVSHAPGKRFFYWTGDGFDLYINFGLGDLRVSKACEKFLAVSKWHKESLCEASGYPREQTAIVYNGVHLPYFSGTEPRNRKRLIYTSAPYRGLALVPAIYTELKRKHPELELHVFAGLAVYDTDQPFRGVHVGEFEKLKARLQKLPDCVLRGNVTQFELARELMRSGILIYPNIIFETCCITALEGQAAGTPVIASANSALPETVGDGGEVIAGEPGSNEYMNAFIAAADRMLSDEAAWKRYSEAGKAHVNDVYTWDKVADRFEALL